MGTKLQPYKIYHPIAYDYAKALPDGWQLLPNIAIFHERKERGTKDEEILSISAIRGIVKSSDYENRKDRTSDDKSQYLLVEKDDLAYNTMLMWDGAVGHSSFRGIVSPAYTVLKARIKINPRFFHYQMRTEFYKNYSKRYSYGIVDARLRLYYVHFKRMYSIVPPLEVQNRIVAYLDKKNNEIDKFIRNKERLINLLNEQKRVVINNCITLGINLNAPMTEIGLEWFNKMPSHWNIRKWKYVLNIRNGQFDPKKFPNHILLAPNHIESGTGEIIYKETAFEQGAESGKYMVKEGDIVYSKIRPELNKVCIAEENGLCSADMYAIHSRNGYNQDFLKYLFLSESFNKAMVERSMRVAMPKVNRDDVKNFQSAFPDENEQQQIITFIKKDTNKINQAISKARQEITSIKEYRESIITAAVTGQINLSDPN